MTNRAGLLAAFSSIWGRDMTRHLMIIGAGPNQLPALRLARSRGYRVTVTDFDPEAIGFDEADEYGFVSTRDAAATVAFAQEVNARNPLHGVMTLASESAMAVASVAHALGLPGTSPDSAWLATHKVERQRAFLRAGVPAPLFRSAVSLDEGIAAGESLGWPVVVKPADSAGSRGVRLVQDAAELESAVSEIRSVSGQEEFLVEEFLEGTEHSIEGVVLDGEVHWAAISDRNYENKHRYPPYFLEDGDTLPTAVRDDVAEQMRTASTKAVRALDIQWGPVKGDILVTERGPQVLEMAARLSGDYFCYETIPLHNGINLLEIVMDMAVGAPVDPGRLQPSRCQGVALRYVWPHPGVVQFVDGVEAARQQPGIHFVRLEPRWAALAPGDRILPATSMGERVMSVMAYGRDREEAIQRAEQAVASIRIETR